MFAITITAAGKKFVQILVFKGMQKAVLQHGISPHIHSDVFMHVRNLRGWMGSHVQIGRKDIEALYSGDE